MRPPDVNEPIVKKSVRVLTLDQYLTGHIMKNVDFLKLDVEGAELSVLNGATKLLATKPRPVIMCEVDDIRTAPWNYKASEIYDFLVNAGFEWFSFNSDGPLLPFPRQEEIHANLLAVPSERRSTISHLLTAKGTPAENHDTSPFDAPKSIAINIARLEHLESLQLPIEGKTVLDVGCGPGHLANFFVKKGCDVLCIDGRKDNIDRLKHLYPFLKAMIVDVEKDSIENLGKFQIVFCYGLLYHLENPYSTVQKLFHVCGELLLLETIVCDYDRPLLLMETEPLMVADEALSGIACRPSPSYVTLILTLAGFPYVYSPVRFPAYPDFHFEWKNNLEWHRKGNNLRCIFVASKTKLKNKHLVKCSVP
jgi:2-polyprenyl-3-methyl-5-hydroxy-6-metoxy-1,4-benzoquinol methylase